MLAEEVEPDAAEAERTVRHHLQRPARMGLGVEHQRQGQHMLEEIRHHGEALPMRQAIGVERDEHAGPDAEEAEPRPESEREDDGGERQRHARALRARERVDDVPEEDRLGELGSGKRHIGDGEDERQPALRPELRQSASIEPNNGHEIVIPPQRAGSRRSRRTRDALRGLELAYFTTTRAPSGTRL